MDKWLSVEEIADHLGVKPNTIYKWSSTKSDFPARKLGRLLKFKAEEIDDWVRKGSSRKKRKSQSKAKKS